MSNLLGLSNATPAYIPQAKAWGLGGKIDKPRTGLPVSSSRSKH